MAASAAPEHIGNYVVDAELGRGAFGVVYRAHHADQPDTHVALKVIEGRGNIDQLMLEPALLSQLDHPCIVGIEDYFRAGDRLALALEFVEGEDLKTLLDRGETFSQEQIRDLLLHVGSALAAAHARNIVHRDIKPSNILLRHEGGQTHFVLTDFGIGHRQEGIQDRKRTGGTYLFMAPEQLRGRPGPQSDLWALGVVAYRMLTGRMPFPGPSLPELAHQILYIMPAPPSQICAETVDPELEAIILRMLDKSLQERVASAEELLRALGYRGRPEEVLSRDVPRKEKPAAGMSIDRKLDRAILLKQIWLGFALGLWLLPSGIVTTAVLLGGGWLFFRGQTSDRWSRRKRIGAIVAALALFGAFGGLRYVKQEWEIWYLAVTGRPLQDKNSTTVNLTEADIKKLSAQLNPGLVAALMALLGLLSIFMVFLPAIAASGYVGLRRLRREKLLRDAALHGGAGTDRYLDLLRDALDFRFADVGFHLKYAEALVSRGRVADAAVEARLALEQDSYNFNGNLLLANAYYNLSLWEDCAVVCERYLAVSGYCFEFAELREQCQRRMQPA